MIETEELGVSGIKVLQDSELYRFTSDSVLLARFASVKKGDIVADFCSGSGVVGFYFYGLHPESGDSVTFVEMQKPLFDLSEKSIALNGLSAHSLQPSVYETEFGRARQIARTGVVPPRDRTYVRRTYARGFGFA